VKKYRSELQEHMTSFKEEEERKREKLNTEILGQKAQISEKEMLIKQKNESISKMETDFNSKMEDLRK
jgi:hypothetical protein